MASSGDEDDGLRRAIALSLLNSAASPELYSEASTGPQNWTDQSTQDLPVAPSTQPLGAMNRKAMEQERLARLAARKRRFSISPPPTQRRSEQADRPSKVLRLEGPTVHEIIDLDSPPAPRATVLTRSKQDARHNTEVCASSGLQYPRGIVKKTWAFGHPRANDIKLEEVLQKADLNIAVLSAFQWDVEWVMGKLDSRKTKMVFIMQAKEEALRAQYRRETATTPYLRLCFPPMPGQVNCMHSKLMLLFHPTYLRIAVPSANLLNFDWGETGIMENSVFLVDLPRLAEGAQQSKTDLTFFGKELLYFCEAMGLDKDIRDGVLKFDFANTSHLALVHTVGGSHYSNNMKRTGIVGLSRAVRALNLQTQDPVEIDFAASSIGSLNMEFLESIYLAASGDDLPVEKREADIKDRFRIYFPTHDTVAASTGGTQVLFSRSQKQAWAYVGSANISESAWGKAFFDKAKKAWKINCRNWECGVLIVVPPEELEAQPGKVVGMEVFKGHVECPFKYPAEKYAGRKPWFFMEREKRSAFAALAGDA
ncbi:hypothetical protein LTR16_001490 [Cryomyces antarcticus]|uniref:PLD phosphodiesterase domain-containing protein n=1 Tax=Cryomyces antarcticus TaxID=329879 RepID=A0ABR0LZ89_9PEZI|nr:hypothetical protein LTR60_001028 [Cryomyces antarcticus]KAK5257147.1 hypothetical protein LTR16_001490 [Cryomyces antarcticus]